MLCSAGHCLLVAPGTLTQVLCQTGACCGDEPLLVMEYMDRGSLESVLQFDTVYVLVV